MCGWVGGGVGEGVEEIVKYGGIQHQGTTTLQVGFEKSLQKTYACNSHVGSLWWHRHYVIESVM